MMERACLKENVMTSVLVFHLPKNKVRIMKTFGHWNSAWDTMKKWPSYLFTEHDLRICGEVHRHLCNPDFHLPGYLPYTSCLYAVRLFRSISDRLVDSQWTEMKIIFVKVRCFQQSITISLFVFVKYKVIWINFNVIWDISEIIIFGVFCFNKKVVIEKISSRYPCLFVCSKLNKFIRKVYAIFLSLMMIKNWVSYLMDVIQELLRSFKHL